MENLNSVGNKLVELWETKKGILER